MNGQCALCKEESELQNSHYMPKSLYRMVSHGHEPHANAPIIVNVPQKTAISSNMQIRKHLLCSKCEILFNQKGENLVIPLCAQSEGKFPLLEAMKLGKPTDIKQNKAIYNGPIAPPNINNSAFLYFVASIFWRGSVTKWNNHETPYFNALGETYQERFRSYLLGNEEFPKEARVSVYVDYQDQTRGLTYFPSKQRDRTFGHQAWLHGFLIPGIRFLMILSKEFASFPEVGTSSECRISFFEWHPIDTEFQKNLFSHMGLIQPKGSLA